MSNEENAKNTEETTNNAAVEAVAAAPVQEAVKSAEKSADAAKNIVGNLISSALSLKEQNPKLFFGILAVIGVPLLVIMMSGRNPETVEGPKIKDLVVGQKYVLKSSNAYDPAATVRLVAVPGTLAAYDDTEEADRNGACQHMPQGTPVTALDFSPAYGQAKAFVKVQVDDGPCKGTTNWALGIDVQ